LQEDASKNWIITIVYEENEDEEEKYRKEEATVKRNWTAQGEERMMFSSNFGLCKIGPTSQQADRKQHRKYGKLKEY